MATYAQKLQDSIKSGIEQRMDNGTATAETATSIWAPLVDALVDVVMDLLNGCLSKFQDDAVAGRAKKLGPIQRWSIRRAVRANPAIADEYYRVSYETVQSVIESAGEDEVKGLIKEFQHEKIDWSFFGQPA
ncbi:MAG: hypothetical protein Fues2KO_52020 [Fuerstiella sp.]